MKTLQSYLCDAWTRASGPSAILVNPSTEEAVAEIPSGGHDFRAAIEHARSVGGPALRRLSFAQRGEILRAMAKAIHEGREELIALGLENGNTRSDAKFDIDGASFTLASYADLGSALGDTHVLVDGEPIQVGRTARFSAQHILTPRCGVAVHINAFNFPTWGLAEKAATALLAGMPVVSKPGSPTALLAHRMVEMFVERKILPPGALSLVVGSAGDLLSHLRGQDVLGFTGSSQTARALRASPAVIEHSVHVNVEADSLNAAILGPDAAPGSETFNLFVADVARDMTQKTGQKCTAIRRALVPRDRMDDVVASISERLADLKIGNPVDDGVRMGPLASGAQLKDVRAGIDRLIEQTEEGFGGRGAVEPIGVPAGKGFFVGPVLRKTASAKDCAVLHEHEVFGPVSTVAGYDGSASEAAAVVQLGEGGLVASVYSDDRGFLGELVPQIAAFQGRIFLGSEKIAAQSPGPGTVLPTLVHGGPGRAGGGEELGGLRGMRLYQQRTALQGDTAHLALLTGTK